MQKEHYPEIDGLRTMASIGIIMMHMRANNTYVLSGFVYDRIIDSFTNFVFLFMVISAFGMCCGYLDKLLDNQISMETFYIKRYRRILPFFALLVLLDIVISPSTSSLAEGFADITLLFGLFPNDISVIGVGWFLGLIFAFYLIFPFFCVLLKNKRRAWGAFVVSLILNYIGGFYFGLNRTNIVYCLCYFVAGGLVYLYREELRTFRKKYRWVSLGLDLVSIILYYIVGSNTITMLLVSVTLLTYALGESKVLRNKFTKFFGSVSMEVYLSHMVIFRIIEKIGLNRVIGEGWLQYIVTVMATVGGAVIFSVAVKAGLEAVGKIMSRRVAECRQG